MAKNAQPSPAEYAKIPGYEFWIEVAGNRAVQYQLNRDDTALSCYIASQDNQEFSIVSEKHEDGVPVRARYYLNDDCIKTRLFKHNDNITRRMSYIKTQRGKQRFTFSSIDFADNKETEENLGIIRIDLFRVKNIHRVPEKSKTSNKGSSFDRVTDMGPGINPAMSEKSKTIDGLISSQSLRTPQTDVNNVSRFVNVFDYVDPPNGSPWFTIKFFYRPLDFLRYRGIAPSASNFLPDWKSSLPSQTKDMEIIVLDSDSEDDKALQSSQSSPCKKTQQFASPKRPRRSSVTNSPHKRARGVLDLDSVAIVIDSD